MSTSSLILMGCCWSHIKVIITFLQSHQGVKCTDTFDGAPTRTLTPHGALKDLADLLLQQDFNTCDPKSIWKHQRSVSLAQFY